MRVGLFDALGPSVLVLAFWVIAARQYRAETVGRSGILVLLVLAAAFAARRAPVDGLGAQFGLRSTRYAGPHLTGLWTRMALAAAGVGIIIGGLDVWASELTMFRDSPAMLLVVVVGAGLVAALAVSESTANYAGSPAPTVPVVDLGIGVLRLVLLVALSDRAARFGVVLAWIAPVMVVVVGGALLGERGPGELSGRDPTGPRIEKPPTQAARLDAAGAAVSALVVALVGLIVLGDRGPEVAALFVVGWLVASGVHRLALSFADSATVEPVPDGQLTDRFRLVRILETMLVAVPVVVAVTILAPQILRLFGPDYARSATMLRLLLVGSIPVIAVRLVTGRRRSERRHRLIRLIHVGSAAAVLLLGWAGVRWIGLTGLGLAFVLVATSVATGVLLEQSVWWWGQRLGDRAADVVSGLVGRVRSVRAVSGRRLLNREVAEVLEEVYQSPPTWRRLWSTPDRQAVSVAGHEGRPPFQIELARSKNGAAVLARRVASVSAVNETEGIAELRRLVPYPIEHADERPTSYLIESAVSGELGTSPVPEGVAKQRVQALLTAVGELHRATGDYLPLDGDTLDHWVTRPLRYLGDACRLPDGELVSIGRVLFEGLEGAQVRFARLHGNLRLDCALFEAGGARLTGILGWEWSERGPVLTDRGVLTLSSLALQQRRDVGLIVSQLVDNPTPFAEHPAFVSDLGDDLSPRALVLLAWLHYLKPVLLADPGGTIGDYWTARNVQPVLSSLRLSA